MIPNREQLLDIVRASPDRLSLRDLAREFGVKGNERRELRAMLRAMVKDGSLIMSKKKTYREAAALPRVMVMRITHIDDMGDMKGVPDQWDGESAPPEFIILEGSISKKAKGHDSATLGVGGRALCRIKDPDSHPKKAQVLKKLSRGPSRHMGLLMKDARGWVIKPIDKRQRDELRARSLPKDAKDRMLVLYEPQRSKSKYEKGAAVVEVLADMNDPKAPTLMSLAQHNIPVGFDPEVINAAKAAKPPVLDDGREDLRGIGLLTIDPVDAKDFDDAIFAAPDDDPDNKGGHIIWIAIADVAHYVAYDSPLDISARKRGNSVYLPDRVEPMLPEELSNNLCSLRPDEDRYCMAVTMRIRADGTKISHEFKRGLMRSHTRLTYAQAQESFDGSPPDAAKPVLATLKNIYAAYKSLKQSREVREPLAIDLPERRIHINDDGTIEKITVKERYDAHKLIEEFMVQANVAAAESLAADKITTINRTHEPPSLEKLDGLADFLPAIGLKWSKGGRPTTRRLNGLLEQAEDEDLSETVGMAVLRSQSQAYYGLEIKGHFGLNLTHYAHFTSPIRRYADLAVHRALIKQHGFGDDGTTKTEESRLKETAEHISDTERRAMAAERDAKDRYIAQFLENHIGAEFGARISGVTKYGLFITLDETGADGLIPVRDLGREYYILDEAQKCLIGEDTGGRYKFGRRVNVRLKEANAVTGGMVFDMLSPPEPGKRPPKRNPRGGYKGKGGRHKGGAKNRSGSRSGGSAKGKRR